MRVKQLLFVLQISNDGEKRSKKGRKKQKRKISGRVPSALLVTRLARGSAVYTPATFPHKHVMQGAQPFLDHLPNVFTTIRMVQFYVVAQAKKMLAIWTRV